MPSYLHTRYCCFAERRQQPREGKRQPKHRGFRRKRKPQRRSSDRSAGTSIAVDTKKALKTSAFRAYVPGRNNGAEGVRTPDPQTASLMLSQLSYSPINQTSKLHYRAVKVNSARQRLRRLLDGAKNLSTRLRTAFLDPGPGIAQGYRSIKYQLPGSAVRVDTKIPLPFKLKALPVLRFR